MNSRTDSMSRIHHLGMTNFDHTIDDGFAEALMADPAKVYGQHAAWDFCGYVYYADGQFHEEIWRFKEMVDLLTADSLPALMEAANEKYGYE